MTHYQTSQLQTVILSKCALDVTAEYGWLAGLRLMGIGRNQYIDLMNQGRTKSSVRDIIDTLKTLEPGMLFVFICHFPV